MPDKGVTSLVIIPSAAQGDITTQDFRNDQFKGAEFIVDQTAQATTDAFVSVKIQGRIPGTATYYTVSTITPATTATFSKHFIVDPNYSTSAGAAASVDSTALQPAPGPYGTKANLPGIWRLASTNFATTVTFSVSAFLYA